MASPVKILAVGSGVGSISSLIAKLRAIDLKHGKFDLVLCTGDFFGPPRDIDGGSSDEVTQLLLGQLEIPIECYIMQGEYPLPHVVLEKFAKTGGELCKNVFLMTKSGIISTANGLRIACLGGVYDSALYSSTDVAPGFSSPFFTTLTTERLLSNTLTKANTGRGNNSLSAIQASASQSQLVDIMMTNVWPSAITHFSSAPLPSPGLSSIGCQPLDDIIKITKPRYHFAASGGKPPKFWEREPYLWEGDRIARFISLGAFGGEVSGGKKQRWFYAFSIIPDSPAAPPVQRPANVTKNPFTKHSQRQEKRPKEPAEGENYIFGNVRQPKRARIGQSGAGDGSGRKCPKCQSSEHDLDGCPERTKPPEGYICRICNTPGHLVRDCPTKYAVGDTGGRKPKPGYVCRACGSEAHYLEDCLVAQDTRPRGNSGKRGAPKEIGTDECWFCLSNPALAKHLIVSIGSECYLTLPKGQIIPTHAGHRGIPGGGHVLIVPITHYPAYHSIPQDLAGAILDETEKYKAAIRALYAKHDVTAVFFEVGRLGARGGHAHVQAVPVPKSLENKVEGAFLDEGRRWGVDFEAEPDAALESITGGGVGCFRVDLSDGRKMVHLMKSHVPFSIQFGRQVLVGLLGTPERLDWKACALSDAEEGEDARQFKAAFLPYDPCQA